MKILNPETFINDRGIEVPTAPVKGFVRNYREYNLDIGEVIEVPDEVGKDLLSTYGFLKELSADTPLEEEVEVKVEKKKRKKIKKEK